MIKKGVSKFKNSERGVTLYMALLILSAVLAMSAAIMSLMIGEFKISGDVQKSMMAIYAADSGLEISLYKTRKEAQGDIAGADCGTWGLSLPALSSCNISISGTSGALVTIDSTGTNSGFNRKVQASYSNQ